jgi:hypothetical protein
VIGPVTTAKAPASWCSNTPANVTIGLSSSDTTEGTASPASLTFTTANWSSAQTVTVTGADDAIADGLQRYSLITAPAGSGDPGYNGMDPADVSATNTDNEPALPIGNTAWIYDFTADGDLIPGSAWYADIVNARRDAARILAEPDEHRRPVPLYRGFRRGVRVLP